MSMAVFHCCLLMLSFSVDDILAFQFTSFLNILEDFLDTAKIKYRRLDGSMPRPAREEALSKMKTSKSVTVL